MSTRKEKVGLYTNRGGYCRWKDGIACKSLRVHQLTAIMSGESPYDVFDEDMVVHHKNGIPWDNRPENLEVMESAEHSRLHYDLVIESISERECAEICRKYGDNTIEELAADYEMSNAGVSKHLSGKCNHHSNDYTKGFEGPRDGAWRNKKLFEKHYVELGMTMTEIADKWGCSVATISNWKKKHGIEHSNK